MAGLITAGFFVNRRVGLKSKAAGGGGATLSLASGAQTGVNPGASFDVVVNLTNTATTNKITAANVFLTYPQDKLTLISINPGAFFLANYNAATTEMLNKTDITTAGTGKLTIGVPCTKAAPWVCYPVTTAAGQVGTFRFQVKPDTAAGTAAITFDSANTAVTALDSAGNAIPTSVLDTTTPLSININSQVSTTLTFGIKLLGTAPRTANVTLKNTSQTLPFTVALNANNQIFSPAVPITLTGATTGATYNVLVKVPGYLQKKLGSITIAAGANTGPAAWNNIIPPAGDFDGNNILNAMDIGNILGLYTAISVPVTNTTKVYDLDANEVINALDVANALANYTAISVSGDN